MPLLNSEAFPGECLPEGLESGVSAGVVVTVSAGVAFLVASIGVHPLSLQFAFSC